MRATAALSTSFLVNHAPNSPAGWTHWLRDLWSHTAASWVWVVNQKDWRNQTDGWIQALHWYSIGVKMRFSCFSVLPGSAEAQVIWGSVVIICPLIAYSISNISAKKSKSIPMSQSYSNTKVGRFWDTVYFLVTVWVIDCQKVWLRFEYQVLDIK